MTLVSGIGGIIAGLTGAINVNIAGPLTAITASEDSSEKKGRWTATVVLGVLLLAMAPIYASLVGLITKFPTTLVNLVTGLCVFSVLAGSLKGTLEQNEFKTSGVFAFLIAASGLKMFCLTAAIWALLLGDLIYIFYEGGLKKKKETEMTNV